MQLTGERHSDIAGKLAKAGATAEFLKPLCTTVLELQFLYSAIKVEFSHMKDLTKSFSKTFNFYYNEYLIGNGVSKEKSKIIISEEIMSHVSR